MNIKDYLYVNHHPHLAITLQPTSDNRNVDIFVTTDYHSVISQNLKVVGLLVKNIQFFNPLGIQTEIDFPPTNTRIKLYSCIALK